MGTKKVRKLIFCECGCGEKIYSVDAFGKDRHLKFRHGLRAGKSPHWKGGRVLDGYGYIRVYSPDHPFRDKQGYVKEHRLVMEKHLGRYLHRHEIVHHINKNVKDNRIENLELMTQSKHQTYHHKKDMSDRICLRCNKKSTVLNKWKRPRWFRHPITKQEWVCFNCHQNIKYFNS